MNENIKNEFQIECDDAEKKNLSAAADFPAMSNTFNLSDSKNYCPGQSYPYVSHWNKDIPVGINPEPEPLIGSVLQGTVDEIHPGTKSCMTI